MVLNRTLFFEHIVAYLLKARIVKPVETAVATERLCKHARHLMAATDKHPTIKEWLEALFSVRCAPGMYNGDQLPLQNSQSLDATVRRIGGWCEMAASPRGREPGSRRASTVGRLYKAAQ
jgi:hypothetical protein